MKSMVTVDMKRFNRRIVFEAIRRKKVVTRNELAAMLGMSVQTATKIVQNFLDKGIVVASGEVNGKLGRRPTLLQFEPNAYYMAGVELEGARMRAGLFNLRGEMCVGCEREMRYCFSRENGRAIAAAIDELRRRLGIPPERLAALGIGLPGIVNIRENTIQYTGFSDTQEQLRLTEMLDCLRGETSLTPYIENDANAAAYGVWTAREMGESESLIYIRLGTGLGGGLVLNGQLRRGNAYLAGEFGHCTDDGRSADVMKRGALEEEIRLSELEARFGYRIGRPAPGDMLALLRRKLVPLVANFANVLDIEWVALDGVIFEDICSSFLPVFAEDIRRATLRPAQVIRACGSTHGAMGAAMLAFQSSLSEWIGEDGAP